MATAAAAVSHGQHAAEAAAPANQGGRVIKNIAMKSDMLDIDVLHTMYLPPGYGRHGRRYPLIYLLHGGPNTNTSWAETGDVKRIVDAAIARRRIRPVIIAMPDARRDPRIPSEEQQLTFYMDDLDGNFRYQTMLIDEFLPHIESHYDVLPGVRGIGGHSMGGYGALACAMLHPGTFLGAFALSAAHRTDQQITSLDMDLYNHGYGKAWGEDLEGPDRLNDAYNYYNLRDIIQRTPVSELSASEYFLDVGAYDPFFEGNADLHVALTRKDIPHRFMAREGEHNWAYWTTGMPAALGFLDRAFSNANG